MPIALSCDSCGKQLRAKDESAGKKIKCPGCGNVLAVPQSEEMTEEMNMEETASPPAPPEKISVSCGCGKKLQVKGELAGKAIKCPGCQKVIKVPLPASNGAAAAPKKAPPAKKPTPPPADDDNDFSFSKNPLPKSGKKAPARMPDEEEDDFSFSANKPKAKKATRPLDEDDEDGDDDNDFRVPVRSKAKKGSNRTMLLLVLLLVVTGLGAGAYFAIPMFFGGDPNKNVAQNPPPKGNNTPPPGNTGNTANPVVPTPPVVPAKSETPDLDLIPRDAIGVVTVRIGAYLESEPGKNLKTWVEEKLKDKMIDPKKEAGFDLEDIVRVSFVAKNAMDKSYLGVMLAKKPIADGVLATDDFKKAETVKVGEHTVYVEKMKGVAFFAASPELLIFGDIKTVMLAAEKKLSVKGPLEEAIKELQASKAVLTLAAIPPVDLAGPLVPPDVVNDFKPVKKVLFTLDETAEQMALALTFGFETADQAKAFKAKFEGFYLNMAKGGVAAVKDKIPPELGPLFDTVEKGVNDIKVADADAKVTVQTAFPGLSLTSILDTSVNMFLLAPKAPAPPEGKIELKLPPPTEEKKEKEPELKKSDDLPALPKLPPEKKPELPLPVVPPEKKPELPPLPVNPAPSPLPILPPDKKD